MSKVRKGIIPAAGLGTRFLPATKAIPKEMLPIIDKPMIQYVVEEAVDSGLKDILFVTSKGKSAIENHFDFDFMLYHILKARGKLELLETVEQITQMVSITAIRQKEPLGLGHAVLLSEPFVNCEPFSIFLSDDIIDHEIPVMTQLLKVFEKTPGNILAVQEIEPDSVSRYGIVKGIPLNKNKGRLLQIKELVEKPSPSEAPSNLAIMGRYILMPEIFESLRKTPPGAMGELQLTDGIKGLIKQGYPVYAYRFRGKRYDTGDKLGYLMATIDLALKRKDLGKSFRDFLLDLKLEGNLH